MNRVLCWASGLAVAGLVAGGLIGLTACRGAAGPAGVVGPRADTLDLLVLGADRPARLELRVSVGGQSVPAVWDETFTRLHAFFDRDGDGGLDRAESAALPSAFALRQVLWGRITPSAGAVPFGDLDADGDGRVSQAELTAHYRRAGLGGVLVGVGRPPATERLTKALLQHLDADADGKVDEAEWKSAAVTLGKLDGNDDEVIGPGELLGGTGYPCALGSLWLAAPVPGGKADATADAVPLIVLPSRGADTHWASVAAARQAEAKRPALTGEEALALRTGAPAAAWQVRFGGGAGRRGTLQPVGGEPPAGARLVLESGLTRLELRTEEGKLAELTATARKRYSTLFAECDVSGDGTLDARELATPKAGYFVSLLAAADRDGDGRLSAKEFGGWLDLQEQIAKGHVLLTVLDHGAGLFEFLDADHDGSLSVRELRTAWARLNASSCLVAGRLDREKLPRHLHAAISRGHPSSSLGKPVRVGPPWFLGMDRNGDGDVSRREFTGPAEVFARLDLDGDGLLSADEAKRAVPGK